MSDRVPIGTHPGSVSGLVGEDLVLAGPASVPYSVDSVFLRRTDDSTDDLVASIRNATAGGGDGLDVTIGDGTWYGESTGAAIAVDAGELLYLRVASGNALSQNIAGWFEVTSVDTIITALTNLARVKRHRNIVGSANDVLLTEIINSVSADIQDWLGRKILQTTATGETPHAPLGDHILRLDNRPIISIGSLSEAGTALVEDTDFECREADKKKGFVIRISGGYPAAWNRSKRRIVVTYDHGYASVPYGVAQAATELAVHDYLQTNPGGGRLSLRGSAHDPGGTGDYKTRVDCWADQITRLSPHRRA